MRNSLMILLAGLLLCGCLANEPANVSRGDGYVGSASGNSAPTISGNPPPAVLVNEFYAFEPNATDADGDTLTFSVSNKPGWARFDSSTGRIYGQPTLGNVGTVSDIVISVTDGESSDSLRAFSVTVSQVALGEVTLSWSAPTQNADGSPLTDLAGYKIYYGTASRIYDHEIRIDSPGTTTYVVGNLVPGTYYFAATSFNSAGVESEFSGEAVRTVD